MTKFALCAGWYVFESGREILYSKTDAVEKGQKLITMIRTGQPLSRLKWMSVLAYAKSKKVASTPTIIVQVTWMISHGTIKYRKTLTLITLVPKNQSDIDLTTKSLDFTKALVDTSMWLIYGKADIFNRVGLMNMPTMPLMPMVGRFSKPAKHWPGEGYPERRNSSNMLMISSHCENTRWNQWPSMESTTIATLLWYFWQGYHCVLLTGGWMAVMSLLQNSCLN